MFRERLVGGNCLEGKQSMYLLFFFLKPVKGQSDCDVVLFFLFTLPNGQMNDVSQVSLFESRIQRALSRPSLLFTSQSKT